MAIAHSRLYAFLSRHWWLALLLMGASFVLFGFVTLNLLHLLSANFEYLSTYGLDAALEGGLLQLAEMIGSGYFGAVCYIFFKLCEKVLIERLAAAQETDP